MPDVELHGVNKGPKAATMPSSRYDAIGAGGCEGRRLGRMGGLLRWGPAQWQKQGCADHCFTVCKLCEMSANCWPDALASGCTGAGKPAAQPEMHCVVHAVPIVAQQPALRSTHAALPASSGIDRDTSSAVAAAWRADIHNRLDRGAVRNARLSLTARCSSPASPLACHSRARATLIAVRKQPDKRTHRSPS